MSTSARFIEQRIKLNHDISEDGYIVGILTCPTEVPPSHPGRVVIISHGLGGHKDYCYQKILGQRLAADAGLFSFRFDFRGCGDSSEQPNIKAGRVIERDLEDIDLAVKYLLGEKKYTLAGLVGHSRGVVALFKWALINQSRINIPTIVNCAGRHRMVGFMENIDDNYPTARKNRGFNLRAYRLGEMRNVWIPLDETESVSFVDISNLPNLNRLTSVYSVYGLRDHIVPIQDAARYANDLKDRHVLDFIERADHNYYSAVTADDDKYIQIIRQNEANSSELSSSEITMPDYDERKQRLNFNVVVADKIVRWFSPENERKRFFDLSKVLDVTPRWKNVDGIANFRDLGGLGINDNIGLRSGLVFRSANTSTVTEKGMESMRNLGIKTIFDLRSETERERVGTCRIPGIEVRWAPVFQQQDSSPAALAKRYRHFFDPTSGFEQAYKEIMSKGGLAYRQIMLHLRDRPDEGILIHCTAGKDRTGVICALILLFMGIDKDTVAREYELTTSGLSDEIPRIMQAIDRENPSLDDRDGVAHMLTSKYDSMLRACVMISRDFGGPDEYFKNYCDLTDADLTMIRQNLAKSKSLRSFL